MKRLILCILSAAITTGMKAGDVTPEEARRQAVNFLQDRGHGRRAAGELPELTITRQIEGLYAFNVGNGDGFVIVSPDNRTEAVLGYADRGHLDPDNIPGNMRAWLKGYAAEIEWMRSDQTGEKTVHVRPLRRGDTERAQIAPLLTSQWNQDFPYYTTCPVYNTTQTLAGCVAVALAQIINYHQWPATIQNTIPAYTTRTLAIPVAAISRGTPIDWQHIRDKYPYEQVFNPNTGQYELHTFFDDAEATAVANLMMFCGASITTDYSPVASGAYSSALPYALVQYFGYDNMVTSVNRENYSYDNWTDLIYHELSEGRPVLYSGTSGSTGHQFVCDGYDGDDFFHMNWGWNGIYDGNFRLSVLDAYDESATTPNSRSFSNSQNAIVGIKIPGTEGSILNVPTNEVKLVVKNISLSKNTVKVDTPVYATVTIKNLSEMEYEGNVILYEQNSGKGERPLTIQMNAYEEKNVTLSYTPDKPGTHRLTVIYQKDPADSRYYYMYSEWSEICNVELSVTETDVTDGITAVETDNSQRIIYDLQGRHIQQPGKGLCIINGKKVLLK